MLRREILGFWIFLCTYKCALTVLIFLIKKIYLCSYNGVAGLHIKVTEFVKDKDCLVCGPGVLIELDTLVTLEKVIFYILTIYLLLCLFSLAILFPIITVLFLLMIYGIFPHFAYLVT